MSQKIVTILILLLTLGFFRPSVFAIDIHISANVPGCGNQIIESNLGEQCEGSNLAGKSCKSIGYDAGLLTCNSACTFDVSACTYATHNGNANVSGTKRLFPNIFNESPTDAIVIFSGVAKPNTWLIIIDNNEYLHSVFIDDSGEFKTTVQNPGAGENNFAFYTISRDGYISNSQKFMIGLDSNTITKIENIRLLEPEVSFFNIYNQTKDSYDKVKKDQLIPLINYFYPEIIGMNPSENSNVVDLYKKLGITNEGDLLTILGRIRDTNSVSSAYYIYPVICPNYENKEWLSIFSALSPYDINPMEYVKIPFWKRFIFKIRDSF